MLDFMMIPQPSSHLYGDSQLRCSVCGQGPLMAGGGHLFSHCLNCGRFQHTTGLVTWNWSDLSKGIFSHFQVVFARCLSGWKKLGTRNASESKEAVL